jgi:hypothetical protein
MLIGSAPRLTTGFQGPTPTNRGLATPPQVAGVPSHPRDLQALAQLLAPLASSVPGMSGLTSRRWAIIRRTEAFEAWVIWWPPGGEIDLHDHGDSAGAVTAVTGALMETAVVNPSNGPSAIELPTRRVTTSTCVIPEGGSLSFGPGHVHGIVNITDATAISVHVYAPRLTRMTQYRVIDGILDAQETVRCDLGEALP